MTLPFDIANRLRGHGLRVVEVDGWHARGRPASTGGFDPVGVLCHHTASSSNGRAALPLLINGRSDLPGPLCQFSLDRQGVVYLVAGGRANHAGVARPSGTVSGGDGNVLYIGIEAQNEGTGEHWPKAQYDAYVLLCAALCVEITGNSVQTVRAHKETSVTGKIDPAGPTPYEGTFDMEKFRGRVADRILSISHRVTRVPRRHVFHVHHGRFYYVEDSLRGVRLALTRLFGWIDLDIQKTKDGVLVVAHGPHPLADKFTGGFEDPQGLIGKAATYADLTWLEVQRLRSGDRRGYRVWRADELVPLALKKGLRVEMDAKTPAITEADWEALRAVLPHPSKVQVKAFPKFARSLKAAHNTGFKTIVLLHTAEEAKVPTAAQKFIDYFRGRTPVWT